MPHQPQPVRPIKEALQTFSTMHTVMLGYPGSGKTTMVEAIQRRTPITYISLGAILRKIEPHSTLGRQIDELFRKQLSWPPEIVVDAVTPHLKRARHEGFILDGVPRKYGEVAPLLGFLAQQHIGLDMTLLLHASPETCLARVKKRNQTTDIVGSTSPTRPETKANYLRRLQVQQHDMPAIIEDLRKVTSHYCRIDTHTPAQTFTAFTDYLTTHL